MAMYVQLDSEGSVSGLRSLIMNANQHKAEGHGLLLLSCDGNEFTPERVDSVLREASLPLFGGTFPSILYRKQLLRRGTIAMTLPIVAQPHFIPGFSDENIQFDETIEVMTGNVPPGKTMIVFVDGLAPRIGAFIDGLFNIFGLDINYVGGGAGSLSMVQKPCLFTNEGLRGDGAVIAQLPCASGVGVCHGWKEIIGPYQVTETHYNVVKTLDWRPAFDVYMEALIQIGIDLPSQEHVYEVAQGYPFGISRLGSEQIVRELLSVGDDKSLAFAGEIPEGAFIHLLHSDEPMVIHAAAMALERAHNARPQWHPEDVHLFIDCVSHMLFLDDQFQKMLETVCCNTAPFIGACTIGEIANCGTDFLEFYNKTSVVAVLDSV